MTTFKKKPAQRYIGALKEPWEAKGGRLSVTGLGKGVTGSMVKGGKMVNPPAMRAGETAEDYKARIATWMASRKWAQGGGGAQPGAKPSGNNKNIGIRGPGGVNPTLKPKSTKKAKARRPAGKIPKTHKQRAH